VNPDDQGTEYAEFIEAQLKAEDDRRTSVNNRAANALTGATGLVTLVLGVFAVFMGKDFALSGSAKLFLAFAVIMLLFAAVCAVVAGYPWKSGVLTPEGMQRMLGPRWKDSEITARSVTAAANLHQLRTLRSGTSTKIKFFMAAGALQVAAVLGLVACTIAVVTARQGQITPTTVTTTVTTTAPAQALPAPASVVVTCAPTQMVTVGPDLVGK
jgi:hypothetical protein